jgi:F-type H+-transporting ATPase subunit b
MDRLIQPLFAAGAVNVDVDVTLFAQLVLFTAFVVLMKDLVFEPLLAVFEARERRTEGAKEKAREMDELAIERMAELETKKEAIRREAAGDRERIRARVKALETRLLGEAREAASRTVDSGLSKIRGEVTHTRRDLEGGRAALAAEIASRVLGRPVGRGPSTPSGERAEERS